MYYVLHTKLRQNSVFCVPKFIKTPFRKWNAVMWRQQNKGPAVNVMLKVQQSRGSVRRALNKSSNRQTAAKNALFRNEAFLVLIIYLPLSFF